MALWSGSTLVRRYRAPGTLLLLAVITFWAYGPLLDAHFILCDDDKFIVSNPHVLPGLTLRTVSWAFTDGFAAGSPFIDYWQPLTTLSRLADVTLYGLNPAGHHFTNMLLHVANTLLLFLLLRRLTGTFWPSAFAAALFGVHPLHVESVAWVVERKDVLSQFFALLTILSWHRQVISRSLFAAIATPILFACSLMSKPGTIVLPALLLLLEFWPLATLTVVPPRRAAWRASIGRLLPLALLAVAAALVLQPDEVVTGGLREPLRFRIDGILYTYAVYPLRLCWPANLGAFYPPLYAGLPLATSLGLVALLAAVTLLAVAALRAPSWFSTGWLWYVIALSPSALLTRFPDNRFTYLPAIGLYILVAWGARRLAAALRVPRPALALLACALLVLLAVTTRRDNACWHDDFTLFTRSLAVTGANHRAHYYLGHALARRGDCAAALAEFDRALAAAPFFAGALYNRALMLDRLGRATEAERAYEVVITAMPRNTAARMNLARLVAARGHWPAALEQMATVLALLPPGSPVPAEIAALADHYMAQSADPAAARAELQRLFDGIAAKPAHTAPAGPPRH